MRESLWTPWEMLWFWPYLLIHPLLTMGNREFRGKDIRLGDNVPCQKPCATSLVLVVCHVPPQRGACLAGAGEMQPFHGKAVASL